MKLLTIDTPHGGHPGALSGDGEVINLARASDALPATVRDILDRGATSLDAVAQTIDKVDALSADEKANLRNNGALSDLETTALLPPIPEPRLILSAGRNYGKHVAEMGNAAAAAFPSAFIKLQSSLTGNNRPIIVPASHPDCVDWEGELTIVFGKTCHAVSESEAMDYVAGYTIVNDVSARDWIPEFRAAEGSVAATMGWDRNIMGKNFPTFSPCGPVITTADEIPDPHILQLTTTVNGEVMQSTKTDDLVFNVPQLISYFSQWYRFQPGDLFTTGSPAGVGVGRKPPIFMKPGDTVVVEIENIGRLTNPLIAEANA